uniref:Uncharacterized protein n=1 Tax=Caenorhabditis japonica TaxID=281687 RepID=A0A8R1E308_CAEJA
MHKVIDEVVFGLIEEETRRERVLRKQLKAVEEAKRRREEQERIRMEMELRRQEKEKEVARKIADKIQKQAADEELRLIVKTQIQVERTKREQQLAQRVAEHFWAGIFLKSVDKCVLNICVEMVNEKEAIMDGLEEFRNRMERLWILQFWNRWRAWVRMKKETRIRKMEMVRKCVPRWESEEVINNLSRKYASPNDMQISSLKFTQNLSAANSIQLKVFMKNRRHRITLTSFRRWREYAKKRKMLRNLAEEQQRRENAFFKRFESGERITETQFKFDKPDDWMKAKRRKSDNGLARKPLRDSKTITLFVPNTSLFVARRQLEDWEPEMKMPSELNKKIKRARESFEKTCQEHLTKKKRDEEFISKEAKSEAKNMKKVSEKADSLLDETLQYTADLDRMIAEIKARRVDDL